MNNQIRVRFLNQAGNDIPGAMFIYARQAGGDSVTESREAEKLARCKAKGWDKHVTEVVHHYDEIKIWLV